MIVSATFIINLVVNYVLQQFKGVFVVIMDSGNAFAGMKVSCLPRCLLSPRRSCRSWRRLQS